MESIEAIEKELHMVKTLREDLMRLFNKDGHKCSVLIGGSYALKYQLSCFADREVHDYDFIISGDLSYAKELLDNLVALGCVGKTHYYKCKSYYLHSVCEKDINILLSDKCSPYKGIWNSFWSIYDAKKEYIHDKHSLVREKDVKDCYKILKSTGCYSDSLPSLSARQFSLMMTLAEKAGVGHLPVEETFPILWMLLKK